MARSKGAVGRRNSDGSATYTTRTHKATISPSVATLRRVQYERPGIVSLQTSQANPSGIRRANPASLHQLVQLARLQHALVGEAHTWIVHLPRRRLRVHQISMRPAYIS